VRTAGAGWEREWKGGEGGGDRGTSLNALLLHSLSVSRRRRAFPLAAPCACATTEREAQRAPRIAPIDRAALEAARAEELSSFRVPFFFLLRATTFIPRARARSEIHRQCSASTLRVCRRGVVTSGPLGDPQFVEASPPTPEGPSPSHLPAAGGDERRRAGEEERRRARESTRHPLARRLPPYHLTSPPPFPLPGPLPAFRRRGMRLTLSQGQRGSASLSRGPRRVRAKLSRTFTGPNVPAGFAKTSWMRRRS
jgi:hypothetical protein